MPHFYNGCWIFEFGNLLNLFTSQNLLSSKITISDAHTNHVSISKWKIKWLGGGGGSSSRGIFKFLIGKQFSACAQGEHNFQCIVQTINMCVYTSVVYYFLLYSTLNWIHLIKVHWTYNKTRGIGEKRGKESKYDRPHNHSTFNVPSSEWCWQTQYAEIWPCQQMGHIFTFFSGELLGRTGAVWVCYPL